jgi:uncharacterized membrane-anchored protein
MKPRVWLAAILVCVLQTGAIAALIVNRAVRLTHGREIVLAVVPADPRDLLRGDYAHLDYAVSRISTSLVQRSGHQGESRSIFVTLERQGQPEEGKWVPAAVSPEPPATPETESRVVLHGIMKLPWASLTPDGPYRDVPAIGVNYGIESYFVPENTGGDLEQAARTGTVKAVISVDRHGNPAIKGLIVNGIRHDETLF